MSDINKIKLLECLKKEAELCIKEKFNEKKTRFYLGRETALTDIIGHIESGRFNIPSTEAEAQIESLKAITELTVKGLKELQRYTAPDYPFKTAETIAEFHTLIGLTLAEIERLSQ